MQVSGSEHRATGSTRQADAHSLRIAGVRRSHGECSPNRRGWCLQSSDSADGRNCLNGSPATTIDSGGSIGSGFVAYVLKRYFTTLSRRALRFA